MTWTINDLRDLATADRRLGGGARLGTVAEADYGRARVRVRLDEDWITGWLPWATWAAGALRVWSPPTPGEQCLVISPSGETVTAVAVPAVFQQSGQFPAPSDNPQHTVLAWDDGGFVRYERDTHKMYLHAPCAVHVIGTLIATADVIGGGVSLKEHVHPGVARGPAETDPGVGGGHPPCA